MTIALQCAPKQIPPRAASGAPGVGVASWQPAGTGWVRKSAPLHPHLPLRCSQSPGWHPATGPHQHPPPSRGAGPPAFLPPRFPVRSLSLGNKTEQVGMQSEFQRSFATDMMLCKADEKVATASCSETSLPVSQQTRESSLRPPGPGKATPEGPAAGGLVSWTLGCTPLARSRKRTQQRPPCLLALPPCDAHL